MLNGVRLINSYYGRHMSHVLAGVMQYCESTNTPIKFGLLRKRTLEKFGTGFWIQLKFDSGKLVSIYFDMGDWPNIGSFNALNKCDYYVKRSYSNHIVSHLPKPLRDKIVPYGLYFACSSDLKWKDFYASFFSGLNNFLIGGSSNFENCKDVLKNILRAMFDLRPSFTPLRRLTGLSAGENSVFYQSRIWDPEFHASDHTKTIDELNMFRMDLVRTLRIELKDKFVGGITPSVYANKVCPDLITQNGHNMDAYLDLLSKSKIAITDNGLHGSAGSKLGEYFAAGKCIVSERLPYVIRPNPEEGVEWHIYESVDDCVEKCKYLLENEDVVDQSAKRAAEFYRNRMAPNQLISDIVKSVS